MRKMFPIIGTVALYLVLGATPAWAHQEHCHTPGADGKLADAPDVKTKKACVAKGGTWFHHHQHCHKTAEGKMVDIPGTKDQQACEAKGGTWNDHGHDEKAPEVKK